jgi:hypothetical protein
VTREEQEIERLAELFLSELSELVAARLEKRNSNVSGSWVNYAPVARGAHADLEDAMFWRDLSDDEIEIIATQIADDIDREGESLEDVSAVPIKI